MPAAIEGVVGSITWAYYEAARLEGFRVTRFEGIWSLRGRLVPGAVDAFKLRQRPLMFVAPIDKGRAWKWPIETLRVEDDGAIVVARLGAPMKG